MKYLVIQTVNRFILPPACSVPSSPRRTNRTDRAALGWQGTPLLAQVGNVHFAPRAGDAASP